MAKVGVKKIQIYDENTYCIFFWKLSGRYYLVLPKKMASANTWFNPDR
jgi:hypothetical protein